MSSLPPPDDRLSGYLDDELAPAERATVDDLLERSDVWRAALAEVEWARNAVRGLPSRDAPSGFWARAADDRPARASGRSRWQRHARLMTGAAVAAGFVAVLLLPAESNDQPATNPDRVLTVNAPRVGAPSLDADAVIETDAAATLGGSNNSGDNSDDGTLTRLVENVLDPFDW